MHFGMFSLAQFPDHSDLVKSFDADIELFELAEEIGYDSGWIAEHLFSTYGAVTSTQVYAAALAQRTKRMRLGMAVVVMPFNHPLRTAADFALVDILSHGRLEMGVGRAYQPHEFTGLGVPMSKSRAMFEEGMDILLKAWTQEKISYKGDFWTIPEPVELLPKPVQKPYPAIWQATISPESFTQAARHGWNLQFATPFTYRTYREAWKDKLEESCQSYEAECVKLGRDPKAAERMILVPYFVHKDREKAKEIFGKHVQWFYDKVSSSQLAQSTATSIVPGYEKTMSEGIKTRDMGYLNFDKLHEFGACIAGDPAEAVDKLAEFKERFGLTEVVCWFTPGGVPAELAAESMRLTMDEVAPKFR
jgi:alkanesulfonate monooxygenase SsuD/methylene tetrahydromethanopterin reductase-like flavin-dependent oxidoreductase (luciferase family)